MGFCLMTGVAPSGQEGAERIAVVSRIGEQRLRRWQPFDQAGGGRMSCRFPPVSSNAMILPSPSTTV